MPPSWTVIRLLSDFQSLASHLTTYIPALPPPPALSPPLSPPTLLHNASLLHNYLTTLLTYPGVRESPVMRFFLCNDANIVPNEYTGCEWIAYTPQIQGGGEWVEKGESERARERESERARERESERARERESERAGERESERARRVAGQVVTKCVCKV